MISSRLYLYRLIAALLPEKLIPLIILNCLDGKPLPVVQWYLDNEWWWGPIHRGRYSGQRLGTGNNA